MLYALLAILLFVVLLAGAGLHWLWKQVQQTQARIVELQQQQEQQLKNMAHRLDNYLSASMQMGRELHELREQVAPLPDKLLQLEQRDPGSLSFLEAARLIGLGANTEDLQQACGLSQSEAELLQRIHGKSKA